MRKLKNTIKRAITLGLAAVLLTGSIPTAAFAARTEGSGQEMIMYGKLLEASNEGFTDNRDDTYTIRTAEGWTAFAESVTNGTTYSGLENAAPDPKKLGAANDKIYTDAYEYGADLIELLSKAAK